MNRPAARLRLAERGGGLMLCRPGAVGLAVDQIMTGRPAAEVERLLPAIFGLCHSVQETALALAMGRDAPDPAPLHRDMIRDHLAKLFLQWPPLLGLSPHALPQGWTGGGEALRQALFGGPELFAADALTDWLNAGRGLAPLLGRIAEAFAPHEAEADLPPFDPATAFSDRPVDNSVLTRHRAHPLVQSALAGWGAGPLAHVLARLVDLDALSRGNGPTPRRLADGTALVPCSRGICTLQMSVEAGTVTRFHRRTPTDHLLMPGGLLEAALVRLPAGKAGLAPLLVSVLDPCIPVNLGGEDA
ncbi:Hydrogenase expression/formation protein HupK [Paracoccus yeei]